jgi:glycosyltransferase involved in cell wall biosynthesis
MYQLKDHYEIAQLGVSDVPLKEGTKLPIDYYTIMKNHSKCCGKGQIIEHRKKNSSKVEYIIPTLSLKLSPNQNFCPHATNIESDLYGQDSSFFVIQHFKPDIVIPINDMWGLYHYNFLLNRGNFLCVPYLAIDSECFPLKISPQRPHMPVIDTVQFVGGSNKVVVFTNFARDTLNKAIALVVKDKVANNIEVIPHGVDRNLFKPLDNKDELREKYFHIEPDQKVFLLGSVHRNQPRKRLDAIMQIMRIFIDKYEKANHKIMCHFHCAMEDKMGWDLQHIAIYYNVLDRCIFDNKLRPGFGVPEPILNEIMNTYDAHLVPSNSEGWHLPLLETMSAGIPNVVTDYSAHGDWTGDAALKIKIIARIHEVRTNHIKGIADIEHAAKQVSLLYNSPKMCRDYSRRSIDLAEELQWSNVCQQWKGLIDGLDISKFEDNRYDALFIDINALPEFPEDPVNNEFVLTEI